MTDEVSRHTASLAVSAAEDGIKLLRFLERRLGDAVSVSLLHKWIRTGQVRVNKGRSKPFTLLREGDVVRLPPFAPTGALPPSDTPRSEKFWRDEEVPFSSPRILPASFSLLGSDLPVLAETSHILVLGKPGGLPAQPGSGHEDSVAGRLRVAFAGRGFIPAPAHRLDRHTSGIVLAGRTHRALRELHALFASPGAIVKEYLAWIQGRWPEEGTVLLADVLRKENGGRENMRAEPRGVCIAMPPAGSSPDSAGKRVACPPALCAGRPVPRPPSVFSDCVWPEHIALALARPVCRLSAASPCAKATLLLVRLLTGRKHQIRAQLASRACPLIGDGRYGGPSFGQMLLHAWRLRILPGGFLNRRLDMGSGMGSGSGPRDGGAPQTALVDEEEQRSAVLPEAEYCLLPTWPAPFLPDESALAECLAALNRDAANGLEAAAAKACALLGRV